MRGKKREKKTGREEEGRMKRGKKGKGRKYILSLLATCMAFYHLD